MDEEEKQLKIKHLPPDITEEQLIIIFSNRKRRGGGPVEDITLDRKEHSAVITFNERKAVDIILERGNNLTIEGHTVKLYRLNSEQSLGTTEKKANKTITKSSRPPKKDQSSSESSESEEKYPITRKSNSPRKHFQQQEDEESSSDLEGAAAPRRRSSCNKSDLKECESISQSKHELSFTKPESSQSESEEDSKENTDDTEGNASDEEEFNLAEKAERTIIFDIIDVTKSKDFYLLYLEDESISDGQFIESSIMLDGLRKHLFVTFKDAKDARALRRVSHEEKSNIADVLPAREKDFNWHKNLISLHGYRFESSSDKSKLKILLSKRLKLKIDDVEILQYDEPRSLIVKWNPDQCQGANLAKKIWKCSFEFSGVHLIAAPVEISNQLLITGLSSRTDNETIERYLSSKRSGGNPGMLIPPINRISPQKAVATFVNLEAIQVILNKTRHELEGKKIKLDYFHHCLTTEAYETHFVGVKKNNKKQNKNIVSPKGEEGNFKKQKNEIYDESDEESEKDKKKQKAKRNCSPSKGKYLKQDEKKLDKKKSQITKQQTTEDEDDESDDSKIKKKKSHNKKSPKSEEDDEIEDGKLKKKRRPIKKQESSEEDDLENEDSQIKKKKSQIKKTLKGEKYDESDDSKMKKKLKEIKKQQISEEEDDESDNSILNKKTSQNKKTQRTEKEEGDKKLKKTRPLTDQDLTSKSDDEKCDKKIERKKRHGLEKRKTTDIKDKKTKRRISKTKIEENIKSTKRQDNEASKTDQEINHKNIVGDKMDMENKSTIIVDSLPLKEHEKVILNTLNFFKQVYVETDFQSENIILKGTEENLKDAKNKLSEKILKFEKILLNDKHFQPEVIDLLKNLGVTNCINKKFEKKHHPAFLESKDGNVILHSFPVNNSSTSIEFIDFVKKLIEVKEKPVGAAISIFQSPKGTEFLTKFRGNKDSKTCSVIRLDALKNNLLIIALRKCMYDIMEAVEKFMEENQILTKQYLISRVELDFLQRYFSEEYKQFYNDMSTRCISIDISEDKVVLQGSEDGITAGIAALSSLREKVAAQDFKLNYFGIREFLADDEGQKLKSEFEKLNTCLIREFMPEKGGLLKILHKPELNTSADISSSPSCKLRKCDIFFTCGEILDLSVDGIINPFLSNPLNDSKLGQAISTRGGHQIQADLKRLQSSKMKISSAGTLRDIRRIIHCNSSTFSVSFDDAKEMLQLCLEEARQDGIQSVAIPFITIMEMLKMGRIGALNAMAHAVKIYLDEEGSSNQLNKIIFCDLERENLEDIIERCEASWKVKINRPNAVQSYGKKNESASTKAKKQRNETSSVGPIKVDIKRDKLTKSETDAIVITVDGKLNLSKGQIGKDVLRYGGESIQDELKNNFVYGVQAGDFVETKAGRLNCKLIMHACLSKYIGNKEELVSLVFKILKRANELSLRSISFPALGTGGYKYSAKESALGIKEGILRFVNDNKNTTLTRVDLIIYYKDTETEQIFKSVFSEENDDEECGEDSNSLGLASASDPGSSRNEAAVSNNIQFGCVTLTVKCGDITKEACDVMVNGVKETMDLYSSGAVCKSILKINGKSFQDECSSKIQEIKQEGVTITSGGKLPCKNIVHINMDYFAKTLDKGLFKVLELAEQNNAKSIAIPALGTAKKRADFNTIKKMILGGVEKFGSTKRTLLDIRLVVFKEEMISSFIGKSTQSRPVKQVKSSSNEDSLTLTIFHKKNEDGKTLIQKFKEACDMYFINDFKAFSNLKNLTNEQIKDLQEEGFTKGIRLEVDLASGKIHFEGLRKYESQLLKSLYEIQMHATKQNLGRITSHLWEYKINDQWERFEPVINAELELTHTKDKVCHYSDSKGQSYMVDFGNNMQYLLDSKRNPTNKSNEIRRRDVTKEEPVPDNWEQMKKDENYQLFDLQPSSLEYQVVLQKLAQIQPPINVRQIQRLQNKPLYQQYAVKKREIDSRNPPGFENEKLLYHGTKVSSVDAINQSGFNRNYKSVAYYGDGVYFAVNPTYSVSYAKEDPLTKERKMYQARVLVGESIVTKQGDRAPPNKPGKNYPYDSGTDGKEILYVIFHDAHAYPEYLITFTTV